MAETIDQASLFEQYASLINPKQVKYLKAIGHDFIEARREGPYVFDPEGKQYLDCDCSAGIFNLGRRHKDLVGTLKTAMHETDQGNFPMISKEKGALAERLAVFMPNALECAVYSVVRGEAFEFACKLARGASGRKGLVSVEGAWFGQTGFAMSLSTRENVDIFGPLMPETKVLPANDLEALRTSITKETAAVCIEPIQTENGCSVFGDMYMRALKEMIKDTGALLIIDETQTGFGRTGKQFAFQHFDLKPDIVILGEALGGGVFPICVTMFTQKLNAFLNEHPMIHLSTFGGSDLGCVVATKTLDLYDNLRPWENAAKLGQMIKPKIEEIIRTYPKIIGSVLGKGLLLSLDLITPQKARTFCRNLATQGVLASPGVIDKKTVLLRPPLTIGEKEADKIVSAINTVAKQTSWNQENR